MNDPGWNADGNDPSPSAGADHAFTAGDAERFRPLLMRYFRRHRVDEADIEDMAQDALLRLLRTPVRADNAEAYLVRIASNLLRDRFRRDHSQHARQHDSLHDGVAFLPSEEPDCGRVYEGREQLDRFLAALDELSPRCRHIFLLQRYEGMTYTTIAKRLHVSVSAVEKHMMRALLHLQARLADQ